MFDKLTAETVCSCSITEFEMAEEKPTFDYHEESHSEKLARKSKESPFMVIGKMLKHF